jgi:hypothetical protein
MEGRAAEGHGGNVPYCYMKGLKQGRREGIPKFNLALEYQGVFPQISNCIRLDSSGSKKSISNKNCQKISFFKIWELFKYSKKITPKEHGMQIIFKNFFR